MVGDSKEDLRFETELAYQRWVESQDWYQTIRLKSGLVTSGKVPTDRRVGALEALDFAGKRVLDVGCNSGQYCLHAKSRGAAAVVGVDPNVRRLRQAKVLAANEGLDIDFRTGGLESIAALGRFDIVLCFAVLTEVGDVCGGLRLLRDATGGTAHIEMGLAKPVFHLSASRRWWSRGPGVSRLGKAAEMHRHGHVGWVVYPSLEIVRDIFGEEFRVTHGGRGVRYDALVAERR